MVARAVGLLVLLCTLSHADAPKPGPHSVETFTLDWKDAKRKDREVPVRFYVPKKAKGPLPIVLFSHGLGGSRDGAAYLGKHWASHGFVCVYVQHRGSDELVWKGKEAPLADLKKAATPGNLIARGDDVRFVIDQFTKLIKEDERLKGLLDVDRIGLSGHSFGAQTTLLTIGQRFTAGTTRSDARVKAAVMMSPAPGAIKPDVAFGGIKVPTYHLTGTKDDGVAITKTKPEDRRVPFDNMKATRYLLILKDGDHMVFSDTKRRPRDAKKDTTHHGLILSSTTAFWKAHLSGDAVAKKWLREQFAKDVSKEGTFEWKE